MEAERVFLLASGLCAACPEITAEHAIRLALWIMEYLQNAEAQNECDRVCR
jgi:hypothetical protein